MKKIIYISILIIFIISSYNLSFSQSIYDSLNKDELIDLIKQWENCDGTSCFGLHFTLSKILALHDSLFFEIFTKRTSFYEWMDRLPWDTFTVHSDDNIEEIIRGVSLQKLKELMIIKVKKYLHNKKYSKVAKILYNKLIKNENQTY
jgi:hypothetical protein